MLKIFSIALIGCTLGLTFSGCGLQGPLEAPQTTEKNPSSDKSKAKMDKEGPKQHREFILDGLIR